MLQERRSEIIEKIRSKRMVKVAELVDEYQVSIETIRRDLEYLESAGYLRRVYGGAVADGLYGQEPLYSNRKVANYDEKRAIGIKAAELIGDGDTLFIDVGTTTLEVVKNLSGKKNLTVITNATLIAHEMIQYQNCSVIVLGGELRSGELSVSGHISEDNLERFFANKLIMGVGGISLHSGYTDYHINEANVRRRMIERSDKIIAVADYSKFGVTAMNCVCPVTRVEKLVTDWSIQKETLNAFREHGIDVIVSEKQ